MNAIGSRINGQPEYQPATQRRAAWREEMLGDLLSQMRNHQPPADTQTLSAPREAAIPGKGTYINLYV